MTWLEPEIQKLIKGFADERGEAGERSRSGVYQHHRPALTHREDPVHVLVRLGGWRGGGAPLLVLVQQAKISAG